MSSLRQRTGRSSSTESAPRDAGSSQKSRGNKNRWDFSHALKLLAVSCSAALCLGVYNNRVAHQDAQSVKLDHNHSSSLIQPVPPVNELPNPSGHCKKLDLDWNALERKDRFPSVEERLCLYMTRWYDPNYGTSNQWKPQFSHNQIDPWTIEILWKDQDIFRMQFEENHLKNDVPFFMFRNNLTLMDTMGKQKFWFFVLFYMAETKEFCEHFDESVTHPLLTSWGDQQMQIDVHLPIVSKWRFIDVSRHVRPVPILVPLEGIRHYAPLNKVAAVDIPWKQKKDVAIWRGDLSGTTADGKFHYHEEFQNKTLETCLLFPRCRLVYKNQDTPGADIGFATINHDEFKIVNGVNMKRSKKEMAEQLKYKMLISIEGNDVASGLKWNLLSNSVVLMPPPEKTIFSMEMLLEPWVHYVPLDVDHVEDAIRWVREHDEEAQRIAQRSTNFLHDFHLHEDAKADNEAVLTQIAHRITALWK